MKKMVLFYVTTGNTTKQHNKVFTTDFMVLNFFKKLYIFITVTITTKVLQEYLRVEQPCVLDSERRSNH